MPLPQPDAHTVDSPEARRYNRIRRRLSLADTGLGFAFLGVLLATGWTRGLRDQCVRYGRENYVLELFLYVLALAVISKLLTIGLDIYSFYLEHQYNLSNQKLGSWLWDQLKGWLVGLGIGAGLAELIYWIIRNWTDGWWLISWAIFIVLFVFFVEVAPVVLFPLFYKFTPLENDELKQRLVRLSERAGTRVRGVYEWKLSEKSKKANAALVGLGRTRRIILADTLLANYSLDEIESILAHELGHHVHHHIRKSIVVEAGITLVAFFLANEILRYADQRHLFSGLYDFANLPLLLLVASGLSFLLMPALNAWSRRNEREADRYAWTATRSVAPFISSMTKLAEQNLAEREPSRLVEWLFHSHPSVAKRIRAAEQFAKTHGQVVAPQRA